MVGIIMTIFGTGINALAFIETNYAFSKSGRGSDEAERKQLDLIKKRFQKYKKN